MISIIIPVYNIYDHIGKCINAVLAQSYPDFELILVDDGSTDGSDALCDKYASMDFRIKVFHKPNGGVSSARNFGLDHAQGEWICFIDGDDYVECSYLKKLIDKADATQADIVFCDFFFVYPNQKVPHLTYSWSKTGIDGLGEYIATVWTTLCGNIHRRSLYEAENLRSPENISYCEDFHLITRLITHASKISKVNEPLYYYRQRIDSIMHNLDKKTESDELWAYLDIINYFKRKGIYKALMRPMAWRTLKATQEMVLDSSRFNEFIRTHPDKKNYILDCPFINRKLKVMMWCLTNHLTVITYTLTKTREILGR